MNLEELIQENKAQKAEITQLKSQLNQLLKLINGFKSERFTSLITEQLSLFEDDSTTAQVAVEQEQISYTREKKKHPGRHKLPDHLPVREVIMEPEESTEGLVKIGEEVSETLEYCIVLK
ncbi:MAG: hypothetical protein NWQ38_13575 [Cellulophaga sp.]|nr:hypothetical protein [Cellulophaga sp.]